jgi:hypothetical protein
VRAEVNRHWETPWRPPDSALRRARSALAPTQYGSSWHGTALIDTLAADVWPAPTVKEAPPRVEGRSLCALEGKSAAPWFDRAR